MAVYEVALTMVQTVSTTLLQENSTPEMSGRVFGLFGAAYSSLLPIDMVVFGLLADKTSMRLLMVMSGGLLILLAVVMFMDKSLQDLFNFYFCSGNELGHCSQRWGRLGKKSLHLRDGFQAWACLLHRVLQYTTPTLYLEKSDTILGWKRIHEWWTRLPVTQSGFKFCRLRVLCLDFALFVFVWWHRALYNGKARNHCATMVSGIKRPYLFWTLTSLCSDWVGSFILSCVDKKDAWAQGISCDISGVQLSLFSRCAFWFCAVYI